MSACRHLLLSVIRPSIEYGSEVWEGNKSQLHKVRNINLSARRHLLLSVIRPSIEYGSEVWEGNKSQAGSLEYIILDGAKWILG